MLKYLRRLWVAKDKRNCTDNAGVEVLQRINSSSDDGIALQHLAILMDGNGRWAKKRLLPRQLGHKAGADKLKLICRLAKKHNIKYLTMFAFSTENWNRSPEEVDALLRLLIDFFTSNQAEIIAERICIRFCGERNNLPDDVLAAIEKAEADSSHCVDLQLIVAFNYGGRTEIMRAIRGIVADCLSGNLAPAMLSDAVFEKYLYLPDVPSPDLIMRPGGEQRSSNFLLWQSAYSEYVFSDVLWPDFDEAEFGKMLGEYIRRDRRYGRAKG